MGGGGGGARGGGVFGDGDGQFARDKSITGPEIRSKRNVFVVEEREGMRGTTAMHLAAQLQ